LATNTDRTTVTVPNLVGRTVRDARQALLGLGLRAQVTTTTDTARVQRQVPPAGRPVRRGDTVQIITENRREEAHQRQQQPRQQQLAQQQQRQLPQQQLPQQQHLQRQQQLRR
jgi:beta-lactam-binding protein with PASTA domain